MSYFLTINRDHNGQYTYSLNKGRNYVGSHLIGIIGRVGAQKWMQEQNRRIVAYTHTAGNMSFRAYEFFTN